MISLNKQYKTRGGEEVRVLSTDRDDAYCPVVALISTNGREELHTFTKDGKWNPGADTEHDYDLIEVKPRIKKTYWINVYVEGAGNCYTSKDMAELYGGIDRLACVKIEIDCEYGEGL